MDTNMSRRWLKKKDGGDGCYERKRVRRVTVFERKMEGHATHARGAT
jgi:hypothetical protein